MLQLLGTQDAFADTATGKTMRKLTPKLAAQARNKQSSWLGVTVCPYMLLSERAEAAGSSAFLGWAGSSAALAPCPC